MMPQRRAFDLVTAQEIEPERLAGFLRDADTEATRRSQSADYYQWLIGSSSASAPISCFARSGDEIVGSLVLSPRRLYVGDRKLLAGKLEEMKTAQDWRGQGVITEIFQQIVETARETGIDLLIGGPTSDDSYPIYINRFDFEAPFSIVNVVAPVRFPWPGSSGFVDRYQRVEIDGQGGQLEDYRRFVDEVESSSTVKMVRDTKYLEWRYEQHPDQYRHFEILEGNRLAGFCTLKLIRQRNFRVVNVLEFVARSGRDRRALCLAIKQWARSQSAHFVGMWPPEGSSIEFVRAGFLQRPRGDTRIVLRPLSQACLEVMDSLRDRRSWALSMGDMLDI